MARACPGMGQQGARREQWQMGGRHLQKAGLRGRLLGCQGRKGREHGAKGVVIGQD